MLLTWIKRLMSTNEEVPMFNVVYKARVVTNDGHANLRLDCNKQWFIPRSDDSVTITSYPLDADNEDIIADVIDVIWDPVLEEATVHVCTDLELSNGYKIDQLVINAKNDGWDLEDDIEYYGCQKGYDEHEAKGELEKD